MTTVRSLLAAVFFVLLFSVCPTAGLAGADGRPVVIAPREAAEIRNESSVKFEWSAVPGASQYNVQLSSDRRFRQIIYEDKAVNGVSCTIDRLDFGTYFFRVSAAAGEYSSTLTFIITPHPSVVDAPK